MTHPQTSKPDEPKAQKGDMITQVLALEQSWQAIMRASFKKKADLLNYLGLPDDLFPEVGPLFPLKVPRTYAQLMQPHDPDDPLLRQVLLPHLSPAQSTLAYSTDPLLEQGQSPVPGLLHKFHGRVLWVVTAACAVHCRYCFRQHFPYTDHTSAQHHDAVIAYVRAHPEVHEVILSGGDPLSWSDNKLAQTLADLAAVPHVRLLRIHTRFPVVIPQRLSDALRGALKKCAKPITWVLHANHPHELSDRLAQHVAPFQADGHVFLNQLVLLSGVNDDASVLAELMLRSREIGILPYYMHQLDAVLGAEAYEVPLHRAQSLYEALRARIPGYLLPKMVQEIPFAPAKMPVDRAAFTTSLQPTPSEHA